MRGLLHRRLTALSPRTEVQGMLCGISLAFARLFPIEGQIAHVLRTRAPCAIPYCYGTRTRLACVKHAASVRSEPGSNSRLKLVAWRKKSLGLHPGQPTKQIIVARIYSDHSRSKTRMASNRFWHIVSVVKEHSPPVQQKGTSTAKEVCQVSLSLSTPD